MVLKKENKDTQKNEDESNKLPNISLILKNKEMTAMNMLKI